MAQSSQQSDNQIQQQQQQIESSITEKNQLDEQLKKIDQQVSQSDAKLVTEDPKIQKLKNQIAALTTFSTQLDLQLDQLKAENQTLKVENQALEKRLDRQLSDQRDINNEWVKQLDNANKEIQKYKIRINQLSHQLAEQIEQNEQLKSQNSVLIKEKSNFHDLEQKNEKKLKQLELDHQSIQQMNEKIKRAEEQIQKKDQKIMRDRQIQKDNEQRFLAMEQTLSSVKIIISDLQKNVSDLQKRVTVLETVYFKKNFRLLRRDIAKQIENFLLSALAGEGLEIGIDVSLSQALHQFPEQCQKFWKQIQEKLPAAASFSLNHLADFIKFYKEWGNIEAHFDRERLQFLENKAIKAIFLEQETKDLSELMREIEQIDLKSSKQDDRFQRVETIIEGILDLKTALENHLKEKKK